MEPDPLTSADNERRRVTLHVFCSVKGGVGKSTLAVACAKLLASQNRFPVVVDADMTGTSLADGMRLCAPKTHLREDGTVDVLAPATGQFHSRAEVDRLRRIRRDSKGKMGLPPAFLNDALRPYLQNKLEEFVDVQMPALLWREEKHDDVWFLPSSALPSDVAESLRWFVDMNAYDWMGAMTLLLDSLTYQWPEVTDVVVDVPPGLYGFGQEMLMLARRLIHGGLGPGYPDWENGPVVWGGRAFVVTTPDANDLLPVLEFMALHVTEVLGVEVLINKCTAPPPTPEDILGPTLAAQVDPRRVHQVPLLPHTFGRIFLDGVLKVDDDVRSLQAVLAPPEQAK